MSKNQKILILLISIFCIYSCEKWNLRELEFIQVELTQVDSLSIDSVVITGRILDIKLGPVSEHGFVWTSQNELPQILFNEGQKELGIKTIDEDPSFSSPIKLEPNTNYIMRAYASVDGIEYMYSDAFSYQSGKASVTTIDIHYDRGTSLDVTGQLTGTDRGIEATKHGFCWSTISEQPTLNDQFLNLGERRNNDIFIATIQDLEPYATHYIRAYAIFTYNFQLDTIYGEVLTFDGNIDFWTPNTGFPKDLVASQTFSIGEKGYICLGWNDTDGDLKELWEFNSQDGTWTQKADFIGGIRYSSVSFSVGGKGYLGLGQYGLDKWKDLYEYDPSSNIWTQKNDFMDGNRNNAFAFSIGNKGYIGGGNKVVIAGSISNTFHDDFWEYNPSLDTWTQKANFPGGKRVNMNGFSMSGKGYAGLGSDIDGLKYNDFWEYDPSTNTWVQKADFVSVWRRNAIGISINNKGYIGTGLSENNQLLSDFWEYNPQIDVWIQKADFEGGERFGAVAFSIGEKGYIGAGDNQVNNLNDFWVYTPSQ